MRRYFYYSMSVFALLFAVLQGCQKRPVKTLEPVPVPADPVDSIAGVYTGSFHYIDSNDLTAPSVDTTYTMNVTISKTAKDSFVILSNITWFVYTDFEKTMPYNASNVYGQKGYSYDDVKMTFYPSNDSIYIHIFFSQQSWHPPGHIVYNETFSGKKMR